MAATQKLYPRATVKRVVKAHSNRNVSKNADILVGLLIPPPLLRLRTESNGFSHVLDLPGLYAVHARVSRVDYDLIISTT